MAAPVINKTKIFVGHLPDGCKSEDLQALFEKYGVVKECDVINKYGFVHMSTPEEADEAIKNLNNYNLNGSCISVEPSKSKLHPEPGAPGRAKSSLTGRRTAGAARNGYDASRAANPSLSAYGSFSNGYATASPFPADGYYDRSFSFARERVRPYPSPYDRRSPVMVPVREDYMRRTLPPPPPPGTSDPYGRPIPTLTTRDDLYERRSMVERTDYLYSRRSPPPPSTMARAAYWYGDAYMDSARSMPLTATRRPTAYY